MTGRSSWLNLRGLACLLVGSLLLVGCVPSLQPIFEPEDVVFDPKLIGEWKSHDDKDTWSFTRHKGNTYRFLYTDSDGKKGAFDAHLVEFNGMRFMDVAPTRDQIRGNDFYKAYLYPLHTFFRVGELTDTTMVLSAMDMEWLEKYLQQHPQALDHQIIDESVFITAKPKDIQAFLARIGDKKQAYEGKMRLKRKAR